MALADAARPEAVRGGGGEAEGDPHDGTPQLQVPAEEAEAQQAEGGVRPGGGGGRDQGWHFHPQPQLAERLAQIRGVHTPGQLVAEPAAAGQQLWIAA